MLRQHRPLYQLVEEFATEAGSRQASEGPDRLPPLHNVWAAAVLRRL